MRSCCAAVANGSNTFVRHIGFLVFLLVALCIATPAAMVWAMNECQLHGTLSAVETCQRAASRRKAVWGLTVAGALIASVLLHMVQSRWRFAALGALACGPWLTMLV